MEACADVQAKQLMVERARVGFSEGPTSSLEQFRMQRALDTSSTHVHEPPLGVALAARVMGNNWVPRAQRPLLQGR